MRLINYTIALCLLLSAACGYCASTGEKQATGEAPPAQESTPATDQTFSDTSDLEDLPQGGAGQSTMEAESIRQAMELRRKHGPELIYTYWNSSDDFEDIRRHIVAFVRSLSDRFRLGLVAEHGAYEVDAAAGVSGQSAHLTSGELWGEYRINQHLDIFGSLMPYTGDASSIGTALGLEFEGEAGTSLSLLVEGWQPWLESTVSVDNDGRRHGAEARATVPLDDRFSVSVHGGADLYRLGSRSDVGSDRAGSSTEAGARADYVIYRDSERVMSQGFQGMRGRREDGMVLQLIGYVNLLWKDYDMASGFTTVPVIPQQSEYTAGLDAQVPFNRHWGMTFGAFAGRDSERNIHFPDLYGGSARLVFVPSDEFRAWAGYNYISESRSGFEGGETGIWTAGLNINF